MNDKHIESELESLGETIRSEVSLSDAVLRELELEHSVAQSETNPVVQKTNPRFGENSMLRQISIGGLSLGSLAALFFIFIFVAEPSRPSLAQAVAKIAAATSLQVDVVSSRDGEEGKENGRWYWLASGARRMEHQSESQSMGKQDAVQIRFKNKPGIEIDHVRKTYRKTEAHKGTESPLTLVHKLGSYSGKASKRLGEKSIEGSSCQGFEIPTREIDPDGYEGTLIVWVDNKSGLPQECTMRFRAGLKTCEMKLSNFVWNEEPDRSVFDATPPEGYVARKVNAKTDDEITNRIVEALKIYAKFSNGEYPQAKIVYGDVTQDQMFEYAGFTGNDLSKYYREDNYALIMKAGFGFAHMNGIMRRDAHAKYFGLEVTPNDADKVLFQWRQKDGSDRLIFGDLHSTVRKTE